MVYSFDQVLWIGVDIVIFVIVDDIYQFGSGQFDYWQVDYYCFDCCQIEVGLVYWMEVEVVVGYEGWQVKIGYFVQFVVQC